MAQGLAAKITADLEKAFDGKAFESTKEQDDVKWKEFSEYVAAAEKDIDGTIKKLNAEQQKEVIDNLQSAINKGVDTKKLFDIEKWISITTDAITPIAETLFDHQARAAAAEVGKPELNPFNDTTRAAVKASVQRMSNSYNETTLAVLEEKIDEGLQAGESLVDITKRVEQIYEWSDTKRAAMVAKTESFRTANDALKTAWKQSGVVKTVRWYTSELANVCGFCQAMNGRTIGIEDNFFSAGEEFTVDADDKSESMTMNYGDVSAPPLHPLCACFIRPETVSLD
jgi:hypothetical protein